MQQILKTIIKKLRNEMTLSLQSFELTMLFLSGRISTKKSFKQSQMRYQGTLFRLKHCNFFDVLVHCVHLRCGQSSTMNVQLFQLYQLL